MHGVHESIYYLAFSYQYKGDGPVECDGTGAADGDRAVVQRCRERGGKRERDNMSGSAAFSTRPNDEIVLHVGMSKLIQELCKPSFTFKGCGPSKRDRKRRGVQLFIILTYY